MFMQNIIHQIINKYLKKEINKQLKIEINKYIDGES